MEVEAGGRLALMTSLRRFEARVVSITRSFNTRSSEIMTEMEIDIQWDEHRSLLHTFEESDIADNRLKPATEECQKDCLPLRPDFFILVILQRKDDSIGIFNMKLSIHWPKIASFRECSQTWRS
ncbi:hypothetical protein PoB_002336100 [Plakobranchus ocellatus]|uniref:Uncharacterized protein n=1 Tax=Plakobranchus ocellatus TaxID=259542 RepID=A0AAV3ZLM9_9GAST|nr:hypothetical protein PoB_002336100 [Plakobranchus ocellatus]